MIVTTIKLQTNPENRKEILQTFRSLLNPIQCELGCKSCRIYRELDNDEALIVIQEWDSKTHLDEHLRSDEFAVLVGAMSLLQKPETVEYQVLDQIEGSRSVEAIRTRNFKEKR
jgi:quinol monooxygenase YgiN